MTRAREPPLTGRSLGLLLRERALWSIYGAERTQPTATRGKPGLPDNRSNKPIRSRRATPCNGPGLDGKEEVVRANRPRRLRLVRFRVDEAAFVGGDDELDAVAGRSFCRRQADAPAGSPGSCRAGGCAVGTGPDECHVTATVGPVWGWVCLRGDVVRGRLPLISGQRTRSCFVAGTELWSSSRRWWRSTS
jgi:hypothetical protein